ncbi:hypothetical protein JHK85_035575 [Glycine max]|nr:hypothetical protein JHK85_035575 [Glycine max]
MRAVSLWLRRKHQLSLALAFRRFSTSNSKVKIFDRELKRTQRDRAAWLTPSHDPLLHTVAQNLLDRLQDCKKTFPTALCLGGSLQPITRSLSVPPGGVEKLIVMDASYDMLQACKNAHHNATVETHFLVADEDSVDLVVSCLGLHWTNDLPGAMIQVRDAGNLLTRAGFTLPGVDVDDYVVKYESALELIEHLRAMGETNALYQMNNILKRDTALATAAIYDSMFSAEDGTVPATFQMMVGLRVPT